VNLPVPRTSNQSTASQIEDPQIIEMLAGMNASADMLVVQRTRRAVMEAANELREQKRRNRRSAAIVALTLTVLGMLLTPAIWSSMEDFLAGGDLFELHNMVMVLIALLFSTVLSALIVGIRSQQHMPRGRR
jgi:membrane glycosyltransferase